MHKWSAAAGWGRRNGPSPRSARYDAGLRYVIVNVRQIDRLSSGRNAQTGFADISRRVDAMLAPALYRNPDVVVYRVPPVISVEDLADRVLAGGSTPAGP